MEGGGGERAAPVRCTWRGWRSCWQGTPAAACTCTPSSGPRVQPRQTLALIWEQLLYRNVHWFRDGLVFKAHRLLHHATLRSRVMQRYTWSVGGWLGIRVLAGLVQARGSSSTARHYRGTSLIRNTHPPRITKGAEGCCRVLRVGGVLISENPLFSTS